MVCELDDAEGRTSCASGCAGCAASLPSTVTVLDSPEMRRLGEEARWLSQEVGSLRDLDVVGQDIVRREAGSHLDETGLTDLARPARRPGGGTAASPAQAADRAACPVFSA